MERTDQTSIMGKKKKIKRLVPTPASGYLAVP